MLEGLEAIFQRIGTIQERMRHLAGYGENFSEALAKKTEPEEKKEASRESAEPTDRYAQEMASLVNETVFNLNQSALGSALALDGNNDFGASGFSAQQALLQAHSAIARQGGAEKQLAQNLASQAARLRPSSYGDSAFDRQIRQASTQFGLPFALIKAVVHQESQFNPYAVSRAGAQGLMQIMPKTGQTLGLRDPFNAGENIMAGSAYLREMLDRYSGNLPLALAAYNAGPQAVDAAGGVPNYPETKEYVQRVLSSYGMYS